MPNLHSPTAWLFLHDRDCGLRRPIRPRFYPGASSILRLFTWHLFYVVLSARIDRVLPFLSTLADYFRVETFHAGDYFQTFPRLKGYPSQANCADIDLLILTFSEGTRKCQSSSALWSKPWNRTRLEFIMVLVHVPSTLVLKRIQVHRRLNRRFTPSPPTSGPHSYLPKMMLVVDGHIVHLKWRSKEQGSWTFRRGSDGWLRGR